ncbi:hypothetical protein GP486_005130 [Trichoglossum hirsutum]|uniref:Uncharacterized protein n=1 Tax=Trichoglossum hirsutum TaxID=265104 RepID=A0A9P8L9U3_9PEZI|nr:hypothetical protein GP486_005130 [Trichoglossum hirsutum]
MLDHATDVHGDGETSVVVADINADMLAEGRKRARASRHGAGARLAFVEANAQDLRAAGMADASFDLYTVAFGIRNFTDPAPALREAFRVLKPGGVFACLEFSKISAPLPLLRTLYTSWNFAVIPLLGQLVAGDRDSYRYLAESIERFPDQRTFGDMIKAAGFVVPRSGPAWEDLSGGIVAIHKGIKPLE